MAIDPKKVFGKADDTQETGYDWKRYEDIPMIPEVGNSNPTIDQLVTAGWMEQGINPPFKEAAEKHGPYDDDGSIVTKTIVLLSIQELDDKAVIVAKEAELSQAVTDFLAGPFAAATQEEAIEYVNQNINPVSYPGVNKVCRKIAGNLVALNTIIRLQLAIGSEE